MQNILIIVLHVTIIIENASIFSLNVFLYTIQLLVCDTKVITFNFWYKKIVTEFLTNGCNSQDMD